MQTQRAPRLQRTLTLVIAFAFVLTGLCIYRHLVGAFEGHWPRHAPRHLQAETEILPFMCVHHAWWAPIKESRPNPGHTETEMFHSCVRITLPPADDDLERVLLLFRQDRHASGNVYYTQAQSAAAPADNIEAEAEVEVKAFYEPEEAPQPDTRILCVLPRSQGQHNIGVLVVQEHPCGARDDNTLDDPAEKSHPRRVNSRIIGRGVNFARADIE